VAVVDLKMPGIDGVETQKKAERDPTISEMHHIDRPWFHRKRFGEWP